MVARRGEQPQTAAQHMERCLGRAAPRLPPPPPPRSPLERCPSPLPRPGGPIPTAARLGLVVRGSVLRRARCTLGGLGRSPGRRCELSYNDILVVIPVIGRVNCHRVVILCPSSLNLVLLARLEAFGPACRAVCPARVSAPLPAALPVEVVLCWGRHRVAARRPCWRTLCRGLGSLGGGRDRPGSFGGGRDCPGGLGGLLRLHLGLNLGHGQQLRLGLRLGLRQRLLLGFLLRLRRRRRRVTRGLRSCRRERGFALAQHVPPLAGTRSAGKDDGAAICELGRLVLVDVLVRLETFGLAAFDAALVERLAMHNDAAILDAKQGMDTTHPSTKRKGAAAFMVSESRSTSAFPRPTVRPSCM